MRKAAPEGVVSLRDAPPRALRSLAAIVTNDLCHRCGSCVGICPANVLGTDENEYPAVTNLSGCTDCDLCVRVCPGDEFNHGKYSAEMFGKVPDKSDMFGSYRNGYLSYATDPVVRGKSTSGGFVSALLMSLIERGEIDGALVIASDPDTKYKGVPRIARTKAEIFAATKSKYAIVPTNAALKEIREVPGRYAIVGLPCQIHGYHKAKDLDKRIRERVVLTVGLFCHAAIEHDPLKILVNKLGGGEGDIEEFVYRHKKDPGSSFAVLRNGRFEPAVFPETEGYQPSSIELMNMLYRLYTPNRCMTCFDSTAEFADIAVGDPWMPAPADTIDFEDGYSYLLTRTERGERMLQLAADAGALRVIGLDDQATRTSNLEMGTEKRARSFRLLESRRRRGLGVPEYRFPKDAATDGALPGWTLKTELNLLTHLFCFQKSYRDSVLHFWLSRCGYELLRVNNVRRRFRIWRRNRSARRLRRSGKISGVTGEKFSH